MDIKNTVPEFLFCHSVTYVKMIKNGEIIYPDYFNGKFGCVDNRVVIVDDYLPEMGTFLELPEAIVKRRYKQHLISIVLSSRK